MLSKKAPMRRGGVLAHAALAALVVALGAPTAVHAEPCESALDCDDSNACTLDHCSLTDGCWHSAKCDDGVPCTVDNCVNGACEGSTPDNTRCSDGSFCNGTEV